MFPTRQTKRLVVRLGLFIVICSIGSLVISVFQDNGQRKQDKQLIDALEHNLKAQEGIDRRFKAHDEGENSENKHKQEQQLKINNALEFDSHSRLHESQQNSKHNNADVKAFHQDSNNNVKLEENEGHGNIQHIDQQNKADNKDVKKNKVDERVAPEALAQIGAPKPRHEDAGEDSPGAMGRAVVIDKMTLTDEQRADYDKGWHDNAFNRYASDMISLHRTLPDMRPPQCKTHPYGDNLPSACVIIIFHNEAWSVLLRTIHSVIDRSEPHLLQQVILVDDFSHFDHLKEPLQQFVESMDKVTLIRASERSGLIRARLMGFDACKADVAIFLDSHCETTEGWLPPLLSRIQENRTNVLVPVIDVIDDDTFSYVKYASSEVRSIHVGGFDWGLLFNWHPLPERELKRINYQSHVPIRSPTMAGGLFAISSSFFKQLGKYDSGFDIWGGENLELSFKTWMCGGTLETIPCSHVGHVFRKRSPYEWDTKRNALKRNLVRLAEVWLDDFKEYYYMRINHDLGDFGDVSDRKALRDSLHCHDFRWYLNNIFPELFVPSDSIASGEIRNKDRPMCADANTQSSTEKSKGVIMYPCHGQGGNQFWMLSLSNQVRRDDDCWDTAGGNNIKLYPCHDNKGNQEFLYRDDNTIYNPGLGQCLEMGLDAKTLHFSKCNNGDRQRWLIKRGAVVGPKKH